MTGAVVNLSCGAVFRLTLPRCEFTSSEEIGDLVGGVPHQPRGAAPQRDQTWRTVRDFLGRTHNPRDRRLLSRRRIRQPPAEVAFLIDAFSFDEKLTFRDDVDRGRRMPVLGGHEVRSKTYVHERCVE